MAAAPRTLILLGKGPSRSLLRSYEARWAGAAVWSLNNFFPGAQDPRIEGWDPTESERHFDVHYDQRHWEEQPRLASDCPMVISPFREPVNANQERFPLEAVRDAFGLPVYLECSVDYMVAYALLQQLEGSAHWERIALPGCDMADPTHFAYRFGLHYWLGIARGMGLDVVVPPQSACLRRYADQPAVPTEPDFVHLYGQPWEVSEPVAADMGWRT